MKRPKKIWKWTGIALGGVAAILLIANAVFVWTTDTRLDRQLAEIKAAGDPLTLTDLAHKPIPPEKNAATYLRRADADVQAIHDEVWKIPHFWPYFNTEAPMPTGIQTALKAIFLKYPKAIPLLRQAADCPDYDAGFDYTLPLGEFIAQMLPAAQKLRGDERVLAFWVRLLAADGNYDEAVQTCLAIFRLADHCERNSILVGQLVAITLRNIAISEANRLLQTGTVSRKVHDDLDAELAFEDHIGEYTSAIKSERAFGLETFRNLPSRNFWLFHRGRLNRWESLYLHEMQALLDLSCDPRPFRDTIQVIHHINTTVMPDNGAKGPSEKEPAPNTVGFVLEIFPGMQAIHTCVARTRAMIRSLRVLNALQTHATTSSNKIPKLAELGLPPQTTTDPFTGEPLHVKKTPKGWLVYSVGPNFQDDGGKLDDFNNGDVGVGPPLPAAKTVAPAKKQNSDLVPSRKSDSR
ncbi:MAG: hypothetical protein WCB27_20730 [Thermoguttaceae bacterium]